MSSYIMGAAPMHNSKYLNKIYLDRYKIYEEISGQNDYELYFTGKDLQTNKTVQFRIIPVDLAHPELKEQSQAFIFKELGLLQRLHHEGLPVFLDSFNSKEENVIITEYREGISLAEKLKTKSIYSEAETLDFIDKLLPILQYLHNQVPPVIYRDLQPNSIFFDKNGHLFLKKYEAARTYKADKIKDTVVVSTRGYNPPEQALGKGQSDARSDLYSVGMITFQLLTGKDPTASLILPKVSDLKSDVSPIWTTLASKATNIKPDKRYTSVEDLLIDIYRIKGVAFDPPSKPAEAPSKPAMSPTIPLTVKTQGTNSPAPMQQKRPEHAVPRPMTPQLPTQASKAAQIVAKEQESIPRQPARTTVSQRHERPKESWTGAIIAILIIIILCMTGFSIDFIKQELMYKYIVLGVSTLLIIVSIVTLKPKG